MLLMKDLMVWEKFDVQQIFDPLLYSSNVCYRTYIVIEAVFVYVIHHHVSALGLEGLRNDTYD